MNPSRGDVDDYYQRSCVAARAGDHALAVALLREALDRGHWYGELMLRCSPAWAPLQGTEEFEAALRDNLAAARRDADKMPRSLVAYPRGRAAPYRSVLALHGNGGRAEESMRAWRPSIAYGRMLGAAASSQWIASGKAVWDDEDRAGHDVLAWYAARTPEIDPEHLVVAGSSMGAETALRLVLAGDLPATGVIALGTAGPRMADPAGWMPLIARERVLVPRVYLVVGGRDDGGVRADKHRRLADLLTSGGIDTRLEVLPNLGHVYPPNFAPIVRRALMFVDRD